MRIDERGALGWPERLLGTLGGRAALRRRQRKQRRRRWQIWELSQEDKRGSLNQPRRTCNGSGFLRWLNGYIARLRSVKTSCVKWLDFSHRRRGSFYNSS